ncbi:MULTISPECIES: TetR/AcrR family transcriptional regulator [Streptomyces]|uniref:TetR/AcrR family transcriptional regulator n=1 Tax=Streptomyces virginiae TaxID=1961 RepID=A0ABZ1T9Z4_STRVG|nr:TetR/AcrR family transcriptional regulator C-terminal domain-containing protein [Streptomyces virginiae]WTB22043.1 TetR/AcrR family transcriptional regulator [Streptomyces virginiae]
MSEEPPPALVWAREPRAPRRQSLSVDRIVSVAVGIADAEGLEALSMRRLAADLGSGTTSLYRHVAGRDELLDLMVDAVRGEHPAQPPTGDWRADLGGVARLMRADLLRHPWLGSALMSRLALGPNSLRRVDFALAAAGSLTADASLAITLIRSLHHYVLGAVADQLAEQDAQRRTGLTEEQWRASVGPYVRDIVNSGVYPHFSRSVIEAEDLDADRQFEFGLDCLLAGIAAQVTASR